MAQNQGPPAGFRGPGGPGFPGVPGGPGFPGPGQFQGPPGGFPPTQFPFRQQSSRVVDLTPPQVMQVMDEASATKKLTTYAAFSIRKAVPHNLKDKPTWARSEVQDEKLSQEDILKQIKKLSEKGKSVAEKKLALAPNQGRQITDLLDELTAKEHDRNFEWTLAQLERKERIIKHGLKETLTMYAFFKRSPLKELNSVMLYQNIEKNRQERMMMANRPMPPPQHQQQQQQQHQQQQQQQHQQQQQQQQQQQRPPIPPMHGPGPNQGGGGGPPIQIFKVEPKGSQTKIPIKKDGSRGPPIVRKPQPQPKKVYHSESSSDQYDSDYSSGSDSEYSDSLNTSIDSRDRKTKDKKRTHSYERKREHQKDYHVDPRAWSPERPGTHHRYSVPEVPRTVPGFDPVAAAYQAGKLDAESERYGLDRLEREREREREREMLEFEHERAMLQREQFAPPIPARPLMIERPLLVERQSAPLIIERPVIVDHRPLPMDRREQPQAIVSYGRSDGGGRRWASPPSSRTHSDAGMRYDDRYGEPEYFSRHEREAEDYMERTRPREYVDTRPREYVDTRPQEYVDRRRNDYMGGGQRGPEVRYHQTSGPFRRVPLERRYTQPNDSYR